MTGSFSSAARSAIRAIFSPRLCPMELIKKRASQTPMAVGMPSIVTRTPARSCAAAASLMRSIVHHAVDTTMAELSYTDPDAHSCTIVHGSRIFDALDRRNVKRDEGI